MTIRKGDHYIVETFAQFESRLNFGIRDWFPHAPEADPEEALETINQADNGVGQFDTLADVPDRILKDYASANALPEHPNTTIRRILEDDHREWVHLYNGTTHDIVELHPEDERENVPASQSQPARD